MRKNTQEQISQIILLKKYSKNQIDYLKSLKTVSKDEIKDLLSGWTSLDIILDADELSDFPLE